MKVGFIGTGNIGIAVARDLAVPENTLTVYDVMPQGPAELAKKGAKVAQSPAEVAQASDVIGICVRSDQDVFDVMEGPDGILPAAKPGLLVCIHSTIKVANVHKIAAAAAKKGVRVVDAPVSRGVNSPASKGIVFMLGGEPADVARAEEFVTFAALKTVKTGALGTAMALKICNNLLTYLTMCMASDAIALAESAGLDVKMLDEVTSNNGVAGATLSWLLKSRGGPVAGPAGAAKNAPEAVIGLAEKDLDCALEVGRDASVKLPAVAMAREAIRGACTNLFGR